MKRLLLFAALLPAAAQPLPRFDAATIKPIDTSQANHRVGLEIYPDVRISLPTVTLKSLIGTAFQLSFWQISGADGWMAKEEYDVVARPSEEMRPRIKSLKYTWFDIQDQTLREMLQALLIERFQLKVRRDTKQGTVYVLKRSDKPLALRPTPPPVKPEKGEESKVPTGNMGYARRWAISAMSMQEIAKFASEFIFHAPVSDQTGLDGSFDYRQALNTETEADGQDQTASFLRLLAEVGLKLESTKGPVEALVVESAQKPSAN